MLAGSFIAALLAWPGFAVAQVATNNNSASSPTSVSVRWLGGTPKYNSGTTFGLPWGRGQYYPDNVTFVASSDKTGDAIDLQSWVTAYWRDGSIKWTGHAMGASDDIADGFQVAASMAGPGGGVNSSIHTAKVRHAKPRAASSLSVTESENTITVDTGKLMVSFGKSGAALVTSIQAASGQTIAQNGTLVLRSQPGVVEDNEDSPGQSSIDRLHFESTIDNTTVEAEGPVRVLVTARGKHQIKMGSANVAHEPWLPFILRFYLYANSNAIRTVHTVIYDGNATTDFISGIGIRFQVPLAGEELYNRHVRIAGVDGGLLSEAVQGITGLRRDPGEEVRKAQSEGRETPDISTWDTRVSGRLHWVPAWNDYRLTQLSPDGFTLKKRTKAGQSWVNISGGARAGGLAYLGGATKGGLAIGLRDFWKKYPTGLDISNAASDLGQVTLWLYSPSAQPMDLRPFHDGLGELDYADQLDALEITYEDYEGGYNTPYGVARTNEVFLFGFDETPSADTLATMTEHMNEPPVLLADPEYMQETKAMGTYWSTPNEMSSTAKSIDAHLDFLAKFYQNQASQRRWYGFWDHGDIMHTYDTDRHTWRYDVGGYAWDNSELSPDLFLWTYFLRTHDPAIYRQAEALTRHTGEVDVYHLGPYAGLGTRHGVQHWGDSAKQIRISTPIYRQVFYYLTGGDERVGELMREVVDNVEQAYLVVDARRKVRDPNVTYVPDPTALYVDGLDWSGLAASWLIEWERRGTRWEEARTKLLRSMGGIANLTNGFVTGEALYNMYTGAVSPPSTDPLNRGVIGVSHLTAVFGLPEIVAQIAEYLDDEMPEAFERAWLEYCYYYGAGAAEQKARYGASFGSLSLRQGHSRLTAFLAHRTGNATLAGRAWREFLETDGFGPGTSWGSEWLNDSRVLVPVEEAAWVFTNDAALYGLAAVVNLAYVGEFLGE